MIRKVKRRPYLIYRKKSMLRQRLTLIAIAVCAGSLGVGMWAPWKHSTAQETHAQQPKEAQTLTTQSELPIQGLSNIITQLDRDARAELLTFSVPERFKKEVLKKVELPNQDKVIALTFDDGPWPHSTQQILEILKKNDIKATFFIVGEPLKEYPQFAEQVVAEGHAIGNHTWHHWYRKMDQTTAAHEIDDTAALIYKITGVKTSIFRPPGGILNNGVVDYVKKENYAVIVWSADSTDYSRPSVPKLIHNVIKDAQPGGIVLMHDGGGDRSHTVQALPQIIAELKKSGYKFVTIPELLDMADKELKAQSAAKPGSSFPGDGGTSGGAVIKSPSAGKNKP